ncbi:MAG TPA: aldose 1-epimerase [Solirubrobacter sp.]|nr:aldose 1-epimerase [Solirubrobacter sp.]
MVVELKAGDLIATFVPEAGMVGASLRHRGEEVLGQRGGLEAYVAERKTFGIPLLYPWANRLGRRRFTLAGRAVEIDPARTPMRLDGNGLPMHGLLSARSGWEVERGDGAEVVARFDFAAHDDLIAAFPFPHVLTLHAALDAERLTITTTVEATGDAPVPIAFGFHPYLQLPDVPREAWHVKVPVEERLVLDEQMLPTGAREPVQVEAGPLGTRTFDDAYVAPRAPFALEGPDRRIELAFERGYPYAQVFAPAGDALIAFEPMTAPTNALVDGRDLTLLAPGDRYRATFSIAVMGR